MMWGPLVVVMGASNAPTGIDILRPSWRTDNLVGNGKAASAESTTTGLLSTTRTAGVAS